MGPKTRLLRRLHYLVGYGAILIAVSWALYNVGEIVEHLKDWDGVYEPSFIGPVMKELGKVLLAACGGKVLPQWNLGPAEKPNAIDPARFVNT